MRAAPIGIAARAAPNRGFCAGLLRVESASVGSRTGAVAHEMLLIAGTGLPAASRRGSLCETEGAAGLEPEGPLTTAR